MKELDGVGAAKDSEIARKDREISGLVAAVAKSQTRVQDLEEANATISEFCSTPEDAGDPCRATIEPLREQLVEQDEELREARATKNRRRAGRRVQRQRVSTDVPAPTVFGFFSLGGGDARGDSVFWKSSTILARAPRCRLLSPFNSGSEFVPFTLSARLQRRNACCYRLHSIARAGLSCLR